MNRKDAIKRWEEIIQDVENKKTELDGIFGAANQTKDQISALLNDANSKQDQISALENTISQKNQSTDQILAEIKQKQEQAVGLLDSVNKISSDIDQKKSKIDNFESETEELVKKNKELSEKVSDLLQKAAAGRLFNSFNLRKQEHEKSSNFWFKIIAVCVIALTLVAIWIAWIAHYKGILSYEFLVKFSISFPVIYGLIFSTRQYTKTRRLEEEYAFKSAISLSLEAYRDLIKKESEHTTKESVVPFLTEAVSKIFSSPSITISNHPHKEDSDISMGMLEKIIQLFTKIK
jgi:hypothetical protein